MTDAASLLKGTAQANAALRLTIAAGFSRGAVAIPFAWLLSEAISTAAFGGADLAALTPTLLGLAGLVVLRALLTYVAERAGFAASARARSALFHHLLDHVRALGPVRLAGWPTGELAALLTDAVAATDAYWRRYLPARAASAALPALVLLAVAFADWRAALVIVVGAPVALLFLVLAGRGAEQASQKQWARLLRLGGHLLDAIQGLPELKIFNASRREIALVRKMADAYRKDAMAVLRIAFLTSLVLEFFSALAIALVAVLVGFRLLWGELDFHTGLFVLLLAPEFYAPTRALGAERHAKMEAQTAADKMSSLLSQTAPDTPATPTPAPTRDIALRFEDVRFAYGDGPRALDGLSFEIAAGETVALAGPSGAGKSTVFSLLLRFIEPDGGRIWVNGAPLAAFDPRAWRGRIAHLPQRPHFFEGDVTENVAMGRDAGAAVEASVREALALARAKQLAVGAPIGEGGAGLSGGEAQRLALSRAFYSPAPLVLLDEPTAHLDVDTERDLRASLARLCADRTALIIAHRLATAQMADRLIVLDRGRVVETGTHATLLAAGGFYARMVAPDLAAAEGAAR
ncbi:thiol reductant ABC exporter subunit CydD [Rhodoblastus acidophilus]|uniref:Thiol reductant ABC exporter subunit CydD n=1 Tax=Rhodoblastus acidophilus TaxID=1074 RepID=A0A6N8DKC2_RHOAC|nr:thiol reductant ABC exporter subunit CydD [Rhodoblastus acidophilus]MCW2273820.1 ATP-binding cassette subfamily C protein CydD [Rhodoblastus acidophilus]MTV31030.1 thiol reductant ABC exporter subunit CydD [Rhodoblastus acidophilus]